MKNTKISSILIIVSLSTMLFAGCSSTKPTTKKPIVTPKTAVNNTVKALSEDMKLLYTDTLKVLVKAKTITQTQSDKVMAEVKKNVSQVKGNFNKLSKLVKDKVITQLQADIINEKIQKNMKK
ncbi:hypothetical protein [Clostridium sp.]|uniref:hypothetical protein n=1 Tax=Clostridium sp. TaxID=1506 RepID=UPI00262F3949|nr:hypothetical protein [uncultured Clostridium sp.]